MGSLVMPSGSRRTPVDCTSNSSPRSGRPLVAIVQLRPPGMSMQMKTKSAALGVPLLSTVHGHVALATGIRPATSAAPLAGVAAASRSSSSFHGACVRMNLTRLVTPAAAEADAGRPSHSRLTDCCAAASSAAVSARSANAPAVRRRATSCTAASVPGVISVQPSAHARRVLPSASVSRSHRSAGATPVAAAAKSKVPPAAVKPVASTRGASGTVASSKATVSPAAATVPAADNACPRWAPAMADHWGGAAKAGRLKLTLVARTGYSSLGVTTTGGPLPPSPPPPPPAGHQHQHCHTQPQGL